MPFSLAGILRGAGAVAETVGGIFGHAAPVVAELAPRARVGAAVATPTLLGRVGRIGRVAAIPTGAAVLGGTAVSLLGGDGVDAAGRPISAEMLRAQATNALVAAGIDPSLVSIKKPKGPDFIKIGNRLFIPKKKPRPQGITATELRGVGKAVSLVKKIQGLASVSDRKKIKKGRKR